MPKVDFYILPDAGLEAQLRYACRLTEEAFDRGEKVFLRTKPADAALLDELLWTFSDRTFLPHEIASRTSPSHPLIAALIGPDSAPAGFDALLVNMADELPADADRFARIAEVVPADPERKQRARERFRQYRDRGWTPESHNV